MSELALTPATIMLAENDSPRLDAREPGGDRVAAPVPAAPPTPRPGLLRRAATFVAGATGLAAGLSILAMVPILQLATLGWLLECEGRIGRTGRWRGSLAGLERAARLGTAVLCGLVLFTPWLVLRSYAQDAALLDPTSPATRGLALATLVVGLLSLAHAVLAVAQGGRVRHFLLPPLGLLWLLGPGPRLTFTGLIGRLKDAVRSLRLDHYLALGTMGFLAGFVWLLLPCALLALSPAAPALFLLGLPLLALVIPWLVMAQARLAAEQRFRAAFELSEIRRRIARAPLATLIAIVVLLAPALPLFLLKLEPLSRDARWLPALVYLGALLPGRLVTGWAYARGGRPGRAHWLLRWPVRALIWPAAGAYVLVLFFNQYFDWQGTAGLFAQHPFLLPVPFPG